MEQRARRGPQPPRSRCHLLVPEPMPDPAALVAAALGIDRKLAFAEPRADHLAIRHAPDCGEPLSGEFVQMTCLLGDEAWPAASDLFVLHRRGRLLLRDTVECPTT